MVIKTIHDSTLISLTSFAILYSILLIKMKKILIIKCIRFLGIAFGVYALLYTNMFANYKPFILLILSIPLSYLLFIASMLIVGTKINKQNLLISKFKIDKNLLSMRKMELVKNLASSIEEELIHRGIIQYTLMKLFQQSIIGSILSSVFFILLHLRKNIAIVQIVDVVIFGCFIACFYQLTESIYITIIIHVLRNLFIIFQKYRHFQSERNIRLWNFYLSRKRGSINER